ncbi:MAG TPA: nuclease, partial [Cytophagales bacterium]|nr:nuclease [Cytophagales bacterium]
EQNKIDSAQRMLADGELSIEQIAKYADLTVEEVTNLKSKYF